MTTTDHPELVEAIVVAAAQSTKVPSDIANLPLIAGDPGASEAERLAALRKGFFAPGHDVRPWLDGWRSATLRMQHAATMRISQSDPWNFGDVPILELIAADDPFKPKPHWGELRSRFGERVTTVVVPDASHALFPEQPDIVAEAVLSWAARQVRPAGGAGAAT